MIAAGSSESSAAVTLSDNGNWTSDTMTVKATGLSPDVQATITKG